MATRAGLDREREFRAAALSARLRYVSDAERGFGRRRRGKAFTYVRPGGATLRDKATLDRIRSLVIPPAWTDVWICPAGERPHPRRPDSPRPRPQAVPLHQLLLPHRSRRDEIFARILPVRAGVAALSCRTDGRQDLKPARLAAGEGAGRRRLPAGKRRSSALATRSTPATTAPTA